MKLIVIRHGETSMNVDGRIQGSRGPNEPLTQNGIKQVQALRDGLSVAPSALYASPLIRAQETANIINERFNLQVITKEELVERDFGSLSGKYKNTIDQTLIAQDLAGAYDYRPYGGESVEDVIARVVNFLRMLPLESDETALVITHRGVIRVLYDLYPTPKRPEDVLPGTIHEFLIDRLPEK